MQVKWPNVIALGFIVVAVLLALKMPGEIAACLDTAREVWRTGATPDDRMQGFIVLGFLAACLLAALRIALQNRD